MVSRKLIMSRFEDLCRACGKKVAKSYKDVGCWCIDYNSTYGGYIIVEYVDDKGTERNPFGYKKHKSQQFLDMMNMAIDVINTCEKASIVMLNAGNDINGNGRRVFIRLIHSVISHAWQEAGRSYGAIPEQFRHEYQGQIIASTPKEYRRIVKEYVRRSEN